MDQAKAQILEYLGGMGLILASALLTGLSPVQQAQLFGIGCIMLGHAAARS